MKYWVGYTVKSLSERTFGGIPVETVEEIRETDIATLTDSIKKMYPNDAKVVILGFSKFEEEQNES